MVRVVLASASPRRRDLLGRAGLGFTVEPADVDESVDPGSEPVATARLLAERKAAEVARRHPGEDLVVLGSDTVVALGPEEGPWRLLGKPEGEAEARAMLEALSGSVHRVVTGICAVRTRDGVQRSDAEVTRVSMRPLTAAEVAAYVASGEWRDKAGGYAIQESADAFVRELAGGGFDNVVGLPVERTLALLGELGVPRPPTP